MTTGASPFADYELDIPRLQHLAEQEAALFFAHFDDQPLARQQELRALLIAWIAVFLPEAISAKFEVELEMRVMNSHLLKNYSSFGWYRILPLDVALFALTKEPMWSRTAIGNIDHHQSSLRDFVHECLALVTHLLDARDPLLQSHVSNALELRLGGCENAVMMVALASGDNDEKRKLFIDWRAMRTHNSSVEQTLDELARGGFVPNAYLLNAVLRPMKYVLFRLAGVRDAPPVQLGLFGPETATSGTGNRPAETQTALLPESGQTASLSERLWQRMERHPSLRPSVHLER